ncbi:hypothetical protein E2C01_067545 [Portunus trituberculatus]|uniref:Uncharacterized protein n=1 Tax=Portunus trituberculatus TaxID=210409 RepID=A0A5B7HSX6_PORTR|nr:hypothetical protein [Portunus trituberculatus]
MMLKHYTIRFDFNLFTTMRRLPIHFGYYLLFIYLFNEREVGNSKAECKVKNVFRCQYQARSKLRGNVTPLEILTKASQTLPLIISFTCKTFWCHSLGQMFEAVDISFPLLCM